MDKEAAIQILDNFKKMVAEKKEHKILTEKQMQAIEMEINSLLELIKVLTDLFDSSRL